VKLVIAAIRRSGMIEVLGGVAKARKILIHINNTNPIWTTILSNGKILDAAGIEVAYADWNRL